MGDGLMDAVVTHTTGEQYQVGGGLGGEFVPQRYETVCKLGM